MPTSVTWAMAVGTNLSAMWILIANGWMQFPTAATINPYTMRMEMASVLGVIFSPVAQAKFLHVVTAGYTYAALFVIGVSSWFLLKKRHPGWRLCAISSDPAFERSFGKKAEKKRRLYNGRLECVYYIYF